MEGMTQSHGFTDHLINRLWQACCATPKLAGDEKDDILCFGK